MNIRIKVKLRGNWVRRIKFLKFCVFSSIVMYAYYYFGVSEYLTTRSYDNDFDYPLNIDIKPIVKEVLSGQEPSVSPINIYPYRFLTNSGKCATLEKLDLFIIVKSAMKNFDRRAVIRKTYGQENLLPGRIIRTLFFLGIGDPKSSFQAQIDEEMAKFKDIIQMDFKDSYYNNTIKTMMSFRWLYEHCSTADYYLFTDDDMYISTKNLLEYVDEVSQDKSSKNSYWANEKEHILYAGYVFYSIPQRVHSSKWRVSLEEYPWDKWPPYITAGAFVVSNRCMKILYIGSLYVKHFRFDDIYLGIVAKKVGIDPLKCPNFYFYKEKYDKSSYKNVIASHGYENPKELMEVWVQQNLM